MADHPKTDIEIIDYVFDVLYNDGSYRQVAIMEVWYGSISRSEAVVIEDMLVDLGFVKRTEEYWHGFTKLQLTHKGIDLLKEYKTYSNYLLQKSKEKQKAMKHERLKEWPKINWIIVGAIGWVGGLLSQSGAEFLNMQCQKAKAKTEKHTATGQDSLRKQPAFSAPK